MAIKPLRPGRASGAVVIALCIAIGLVVVVGYKNAIADPVVRRLIVRMDAYPVGAAPVRIVLFSDVHVHGPDMPPSRVRRIVDQINALHPEVIIGAGDYSGDNWIGSDYPIDEAIAPLSGLRARLGVYAVLGNNDYNAQPAEVTKRLEAAGVHVLSDSAASVGPLAIGGIDGQLHVRRGWREVRQKTYDALAETRGVPIFVAHRPDEFKAARPWVKLVLAGHTHCGQIVLPFIGPLVTGSDYGRKYLCGVIRNGSQLMVVTAGIGTSHIPLRIGAPPDIWLITITGAGSSSSSHL